MKWVMIAGVDVGWSWKKKGVLRKVVLCNEVSHLLPVHEVSGHILPRAVGIFVTSLWFSWLFDIFFNDTY